MFHQRKVLQGEILRALFLHKVELLTPEKGEQKSEYFVWSWETIMLREEKIGMIPAENM